MKEERWKLICEGLGLDYDEIIADVPAELRPPSVPAAEMQQEEAICCDTAAGAGMTTIKADSESLFLLAMYAEGRLAHDIEAGMKVDPMKLWGILDALRTIKQATI